MYRNLLGNNENSVILDLISSKSDMEKSKSSRRLHRLKGGKELQRPINSMELGKLTASNISIGINRRPNVHAAPLTPLREQDAKALNSFFDRDDLDEIETDIKLGLSRRCPEPCWEDHSLDFLQDYL